jgi:hypothetical protein
MKKRHQWNEPPKIKAHARSKQLGKHHRRMCAIADREMGGKSEAVGLWRRSGEMGENRIK